VKHRFFRLHLFAVATLWAWTGLVPAEGRTELVVGDRGFALTAIEGEKIEQIPLEYLGTLRDFAGPGHDLYIVRLQGPIAEQVGVAAGMSGSPVYVENRLIGALAYRLGGLPREAIGGVTPIEGMLRADTLPAGAEAPAGMQAQPIATPIVAQGLTGELREWFAEQLAPDGFVLAAGGAAGSGDEDAAELAPGSPVGVALVQGDLEIAATGTVTQIEGDRVLAFGHPFLGSGRVELPMLTARVIHTLADMAGSVKLAEVGGAVGAIVEDRLTAVVGRLDREAPMIPVRLTVQGGAYDERSYDYRIAKATTLTPLLAGIVVSGSLVGETGYDRAATVLLRGRIELAGLPDLEIERAFAHEGAPDPTLAVAGAVQQLLGVLWTNELSTVDVRSMAFDVEVDPEVLRYRVEDLHYARGPLRPGETLAVTCVLRRFRGETETRELRLMIPDGLTADTQLTLVVGPPAQVERTLGQPLAGRLRSATDLASVVRTLNDIESSHRLTAALVRGATGVVSRGEVYESLPPTAERLLGANGSKRPAARTRVARLDTDVVELDGPVEGGVAIRLKLDGDLPLEAERPESPGAKERR